MSVRLDTRMIGIGNRRVQGASQIFGSIGADVAKHATCDVLIVNTTARCISRDFS